jgi:hypothetical protein
MCNLVLDSKFRGTSLVRLPLVKLCRKKLNPGAICIFQEFEFVSVSRLRAHIAQQSLMCPDFFVRNGTIHSFGFHNGSVGVDVLLSVGERS